MKLKLLITGAIAAAALSGCATYETAGPNGPGGYYQGRPQTQYYGGGYYGYPGSVYGGYYDSPYYYSGRQPYYGYYGPYYPYYAPPPPRPPRPDHGNGHQPPPPPGSGPGGNRPAPWRDPTRGAWRDQGQQPMVPGQPPRQMAPSNRPMPQGVRPAPGQPPRVSPGAPSTPRAMPRSPSERPAAAPRVEMRGGRVKVVDP